MSVDRRSDIEMALVRILATDGLLLSGISAEDKRERIRLAILQRGLSNRAWPLDGHMTYGQAFEHCYKRQVEMRRAQRDQFAQPLAATRVGQDDDDDAGEDDDDEGAKRSNTAA